MNILGLISQLIGIKTLRLTTTMLSKPPFPTFNQFVTALQGYDMRNQGTQFEEKEEPNQNIAFVAQRNRGRDRFYSRGRNNGHPFSSWGHGFAPAGFAQHSFGCGFYSNHMDQFSPHDTRGGTPSKGVTFQPNHNQQQQSQKPPTQCQICDRIGHPAFKCWYRYDYSHETNENLSQALATTTLSDAHDHDPNWYIDTGPHLI